MSWLYIIVVNHRCMSQLYIIGHLEFPRDPLGRGSILDQWEPCLSDVGSQSLFSSAVFATVPVLVVGAPVLQGWHKVLTDRDDS